MSASDASRPVRLALTADVHADAAVREPLAAAFRSLPPVDLVLMAGDLTTLGQVEQAQVLAEACAELPAPAVAVLGNHDFHSGQEDDIRALLEDAGVAVLDGRAAAFELRGHTLGVAGAKGFVGGFPDWELSDFGEPLLRQLYDATSMEVAGLAHALEEIAGCDLRIAMLHYAPSSTTLVGEREILWPFLGSHRLGVPILQARPHLVLHGHAHAGTFRGQIDGIPVLNVAMALTGGEFTLVELERAADGAGRVRVLGGDELAAGALRPGGAV
jgi:Icc-related predicted phosphoesterase